MPATGICIVHVYNEPRELHTPAPTGIILTNGRIRPRCRQRVACVRGEAAWRLQVVSSESLWRYSGRDFDIRRQDSGVLSVHQ